MLHIVLPVGISFYTFQSMAYTIDVYRGVTKPARSLFNFALFVSYFPAAGRRSHRALPRSCCRSCENERRYRKGDFAEGLYHILLGLFKKVVIADNLAPIANHVFDTPAAELTGTEMLIGVYAFAFQIYGDFSGYSSIAQGVSKWLGIDLSYNFRMPYFSRSPSEFWQRWHISLSQLAARLSVHPAGRQPPRPAAHLYQPDADDAARRPVARRRLDLRRLGRVARRCC